MTAHLPNVATIIADVLGLRAGHGIGPATRLCADLGTDSLDRQTIAADCDVRFGIEIPDADVAEWETIADVAGTVARLCREGVGV